MFELVFGRCNKISNHCKIVFRSRYFYALIVDYDEKESELNVMEKVIDGLRVVGQPLIAVGLTVSQISRGLGGNLEL